MELTCVVYQSCYYFWGFPARHALPSNLEAYFHEIVIKNDSLHYCYHQKSLTVTICITYIESYNANIFDVFCGIDLNFTAYIQFFSRMN